MSKLFINTEKRVVKRSV